MFIDFPLTTQKNTPNFVLILVVFEDSFYVSKIVFGYCKTKMIVQVEM
jgi:hypothetical protein